MFLFGIIEFGRYVYTVQVLNNAAREGAQLTVFPETLDLIIRAVRVVDSLDDAIDHVNTYGTAHTDAIVTSDYEAARRFAAEVDSACVMINASTLLAICSIDQPVLLLTSLAS